MCRGIEYRAFPLAAAAPLKVAHNRILSGARHSLLAAQPQVQLHRSGESETRRTSVAAEPQSLPLKLNQIAIYSSQRLAAHSQRP